MKIRKAGPIVAAIVVPALLLILLLVLAGSAGADRPEALPNSPPVPVPYLINYQGRLLDDTGTPINDTVDLTFGIWRDPGDPIAVWEETHFGVPVSDGYFDVLLGETSPLWQSYFLDDDDIELEVKVNGDSLTPKQRIASVAYAIVANTLVPGADISGYIPFPGTMLEVGNNDTGVAIRGTTSGGPAIHGISEGWDTAGVAGTNDSGNPSTGVYGRVATGWAMKGEGNDGVGLYANSTSTYGVRGESTDSYGGYFSSSNAVGLRAESTGSDGWRDWGIHGVSATAAAVYGQTDGGMGVRGYSSNNYGVYGRSTNSYGGRFYSSEGVGLYAESDGNNHYDHGAEIHSDWGYGLYVTSQQNHAIRAVGGSLENVWQPTGAVGVFGGSRWRTGVYGSSYNSYGTYGRSVNSHGVYGQGGSGFGDYGGYFRGYRGVYADATGSSYGLYTPDSIYVGGSCTGCDIAEAWEMATDVEAGDVVVIDPQDGGLLIRSARPYDTAVAGIVSGEPALLVGQSNDETPLALAGRVPCKVSAENGPILPGDLLTTSSTPGHAMKAEPVAIEGLEIYPPGTILGKALEPLEEGTGVIMVLVALQ